MKGCVATWLLERDTRFELVTHPWQGRMLPLHQSRRYLVVVLHIGYHMCGGTNPDLVFSTRRASFLTGGPDPSRTDLNVLARHAHSRFATSPYYMVTPRRFELLLSTLKVWCVKPITLRGDMKIVSFFY